MIDKDYVGSWKILFGYCTGNPATKNAKWFTVETIIRNETLGRALWKARKKGYSRSEDICADFIFSVTDALNGKRLDERDVDIAMLEANQLLYDETGTE